METGNIATTDQLFQSIAGMTNAEAVPIGTGMGGVYGNGSGSSDSSTSGPAPASSPAPSSSNPAPSPTPSSTPATSASLPKGSYGPNNPLPDSVLNNLPANFRTLYSQNDLPPAFVYPDLANLSIPPAGSASIINGLSPGGSVQTDIFGTGSGGIGTTIKMNSDGTYTVNGPSVDYVNVPADAMKVLMSGNASVHQLSMIEKTYTPLFGQSPSTASNYNPALMNGGLGGQGDLTLNNGTLVNQFNYPEYALEQEIKGMKENSGGTFGMIAGMIAKAAAVAAGTFVGGPALGAALAAGITEVQTQDPKAAALSGAESFAGATLMAAL